jgi:hypothetical protein
MAQGKSINGGFQSSMNENSRFQDFGPASVPSI